MKKSKFSEEQIASPCARSKADAAGRCVPTAGCQRSHLLHLEIEIAPGRQRAAEAAVARGREWRVKRLFADLTLDKHMPAEALRKKV